MIKTYVSILGICLFTFVANAQTNDVSNALQKIAQNNKELVAYSSLLESKKLQLKSTNSLPGPNVGAYYLPFGKHSSTDYTEFQITQTFEYPTVYKLRNQLIDKQSEQQRLEFLSKKQEILYTAKLHCLEIVNLNKQNKIEQERVLQSKKIFDQVKILFDKGQIGILVFNKAKVVWMREQFAVKHIQHKREALLLILKNLNGGEAVAVNETGYDENLYIETLANLWNDKQLSDPVLKSNRQNEEIALDNIQLVKKQSLPNITAGINGQGFSGEYYSGVFGGFSIPLWNNKNKVKSAELNYQFRQSYTNVHSQKLFVEYEEQYIEFAALTEKYREYQKTMNGLNSSELLFQAYKLGELSYMDYYQEMQFYNEAIDAMIAMKHELDLLKASLLKHQL